MPVLVLCTAQNSAPNGPQWEWRNVYYLRPHCRMLTYAQQCPREPLRPCITRFEKRQAASRGGGASSHLTYRVGGQLAPPRSYAQVPGGWTWAQVLDGWSALPGSCPVRGRRGALAYRRTFHVPPEAHLGARQLPHSHRGMCTGPRDRQVHGLRGCCRAAAARACALPVDG